jgi:hypothetical protein
VVDSGARNRQNPGQRKYERVWDNGLDEDALDERLGFRKATTTNRKESFDAMRSFRSKRWRR